jgi:hypothetical protein
MQLYDVKMPIHELSEFDQPIEKLDEMLNQYGIRHCFALPSNEEIENDPKPLICNMYYLAEQNLEVTLIVGLFIKLYGKKDAQEIRTAIVKSFSKWL